jgi:small subunit ribosomal protein S6
VKETVVKFKKSLKDAGAKLMHEEDWGLKKLAYPIQKKSTGFYHLFEYEMEGEGIATMEVNLK